MEGTIARLIREKQFGFIKSRNKDFFFHKSGLVGIDYGDLTEGMNVEFTEKETTKGMRAENVRIMGWSQD